MRIICGKKIPKKLDCQVLGVVPAVIQVNFLFEKLLKSRLKFLLLRFAEPRKSGMNPVQKVHLSNCMVQVDLAGAFASAWANLVDVITLHRCVYNTSDGR